MKIHFQAAFVAALLAALCTPGAQATVLTYDVTISGAESVPPNATPATGSAVVIVDDVLNTVSVDLTFSGLIGGPATAAHIHCCVPPTANGPVVIPFTSFPNTTSGTYSNIFSGVSTADIQGIENGLAYINIHNAEFPAGEIRGDILAAVPEPTTLGLLGLAIGAFGLWGIKHRAPQR